MSERFFITILHGPSHDHKIVAKYQGGVNLVSNGLIISSKGQFTKSNSGSEECALNDDRDILAKVKENSFPMLFVRIEGTQVFLP